MIRADQRDFQKSYRKHYHTFISCYDNSKFSEISRSLILVYCVESGLKYILMKENRISNTAKAGKDLYGLLKSHDFERLLTVIPRCPKSNYRFPPFKTKHGDEIRANNYHQMLRYAIQSENYEIVQNYNGQLKEIADWLNERMNTYGA